jgi:hypothetical protein
MQLYCISIHKQIQPIDIQLKILAFKSRIQPECLNPGPQEIALGDAESPKTHL